MTRKAAERRAAGLEVLDLSAGQPDFPSPAVAVESARRALGEGFTHYTVAAGLPDLRAALAERYRGRDGAPWDGADVLVTVGAKAALMQTMLIALDEGDSAVYPTPAWVSFAEQIRFAGARTLPVPMAAEDGFTIHPEPLIEALEDTTRLVLLNSPSNPTGGILDADGLRRLVTACAERGVLVVADETYEAFVYDGRRHASAAALAREFPDTVAVISSFSKTYSMTGWRVGWLAGPRALIDRVSALQGHTTSNVTSFAMRGALAALEGADELVRLQVDEMARRRARVVEALAGLRGVSCPSPAGAFYVFPEVTELLGGDVPGSLELAEVLLETTGVALVPGVAFEREGHLRLSFAGAPEVLDAALERLGGFFARRNV